MATENQNTAKRTKRKRDVPSGDPSELEKRTRVECERRFETVWGMPLMRKPNEKAPEMLRLIAGFWAGEEANKATENEARILLGELRGVMAKIPTRSGRRTAQEA